ncbi:hypothetical protein NL676_001542 [Syzygium grande]|nr:hypothetical protein NL676_001542 [Syzygium grande]
MASYRNIVLIALLFLISTTPRTHGVVIRGFTKVNVQGLLSCVVPGTLPTLSGPPLRGVSVNITCNGGTTTLGQAVTNTAGFFNATFDILEDLLFDSSTCVGTVNLSSITRCSVFPPTGILRLTLDLVRIVDGVVQFVLGLIVI